MKSAERPALADYPFYLLLLPVFFLLHGWAAHPLLVNARDVAALLPWMLAAIAAPALLLARAWRNWQRAGLMTGALAGTYFFFGIAHDQLKAIVGTGFFSSYSLLLPLLAASLLLLFRYLRRTTAPFRRLTRYLNLLLLLLPLPDGVGALVRPGRNGAATALPALPAASLPGTADRPDIYLVVADGYAGDLALAAQFGFSNKAFKDALAERGFRVLPATRSNYNYTAFSMASLLSMDFLPLPDSRYSADKGRQIAFPLIRQSRFAGFLERAGYQVRNHSVFPVGDSPAAFTIPFFQNGTSVLLLPTLWSRLNRDLRFHLVTRFHLRPELRRLARYEVAEGNEEMMARTLAASRETGAQPRFVYTHLMLPHDPYFYRKDGTPAPVEQLADYRRKDPALYLEYLQYANGRLLALVDGIRAGSARPPVILLMSDHGYRGDATHRVPRDLQFSNLNAVYLPSGNYAAWYPGVSNVNHLRILLNTQFGQQLPLLRDSVSFLEE